MEKALYTIDESMTYAGLRKTSIYDALAEGKLKGRKYGRRTLVEAESLRAFVASFPAMSFKPKRKNIRRSSKRAEGVMHAALEKAIIESRR